MARKLKPPKNYRRIKRRCCANCRYWQLDEAADYACLRAPDTIAGGWNELEPEFHVCNGHKTCRLERKEVRHGAR
jgi:hypothetical protein